MRDIVLVRDGIHADEVGGVGAGQRVGGLAEGEIVEVVDQCGKVCRIIYGEVEGSRICFLHREVMSDMPWELIMVWRKSRDPYLELPTEQLAKILRLDPENGLVYLPLSAAACDGEVREQGIWKETAVSLVRDHTRL